MNKLLKTVKRNPILICRNCLFTEDSLGLTAFNKWCDRRRKNNEFDKNEVLSRIEPHTLTSSSEVVKALSSSFILTDDFKSLVAFASAQTSKSTELVVDLCRRYSEQCKKTKISYFNFGPLIMRLFHASKRPDLAVNAIQDPTMPDFFDQLSSYQICMDLLYETGKYAQVLSMFDFYQNHSKLASQKKYPRSLLVLVYASLYKMNSREAFDKALHLYSMCREETSTNIPRKALMYFVGLCVHLSEDRIGYELLSTTNCDDFVVGRSLKILLASKLNRTSTIFNLFQKTIESDLPSSSFEDYELSYEVIEAVERGFAKKDTETQEKLQRYLDLLRKGKHFANVSVDDLICAPIVLAPSTTSMEEFADEEQIARLSAPDADDQRLTALSYDDDESESLESFEKFSKAEKRLKRQERIITNAIARKIAVDGPFQP